MSVRDQKQTKSRAKLQPLNASRIRTVLRLPLTLARILRERADDEDRARLIANFCAPESGQPIPLLGVMWPYPTRPGQRPRRQDPLELLWNLPAREPPGPR